MDVEITKTVIEQLFHSPIFFMIYGAAFIFSVHAAFEFALFRKKKNRKEMDWIERRLAVGTGFVIITYLFYIMAFENLSYIELNFTAGISFLGLLVCALITTIERYRIGQKTLDKFISFESS